MFFNFRIRWDGEYVAGLSTMSALSWSKEPLGWREGGSPSFEHQIPGFTTFEAITLERGITHDVAFEEWANAIHDLANPFQLSNFRKDISIDVFNEAGQLAKSYKVFRCWVSQYQALPELDASTAAISIESIQLTHEGFQRDLSVTEPSEP